ncbi:MAG: metal-sensing transcriptional repressor [Bacteroidetes bacterium]|nr:metal-sensing transcriptional repressor [Bacteroidota bacterium]HET6244123.1 metal-sensing transcriptional repressor [Bacteroidia bacterium]
MISSDLTRNIKVSVKTAVGQLNYILKQVDNEQQAVNVLLQLKAVQAILSKTTYELLDDTYRKALAEKISSAYQNCPGNCGNEEIIERLRKLFPDFALEDVPEKLKEVQQVETSLQKYLSNNLDTPHPLD